MTVIKLNINGEFRRISTKSYLKFLEFVKTISEGSEYIFSYDDEDGDQIRFSSEEEYQLMIESSKLVRVFATPISVKAISTPAIVAPANASSPSYHSNKELIQAAGYPSEFEQNYSGKVMHRRGKKAFATFKGHYTYPDNYEIKLGTKSIIVKVFAIVVESNMPSCIQKDNFFLEPIGEYCQIPIAEGKKGTVVAHETFLIARRENKKVLLAVKLDISKLKTGFYSSHFRLIDSKGVRFGERMRIKIHITEPEVF